MTGELNKISEKDLTVKDYSCLKATISQSRKRKRTPRITYLDSLEVGYRVGIFIS